MKKIFCLMIIAAASFSCTDDDIKTEQVLNQGPRVVGFSKEFEAVSYFVDEGDVEHVFPLDLIGGSDGSVASQDIVATYEIDPSSTATLGYEYDFIETQGQITIPAGSTFGYLPINVHTANFDRFVKKSLVINLTTSTNSVVGEQYRQFTIYFVGCLSVIQTGSYTAVISQPAGVRTRTNENISLTGINTFSTRYVGLYTLGTFTPAGYKFIDICNEITVPKQQLGQYSNLVRGLEADNGLNGTVTDPTHFNTKYEITFAAGNITHRTTYTHN
jgi:hypothetical protein